MIYCCFYEELLDFEGEIFFFGEFYGIDLCKFNVDEVFVGECFFVLDLDWVKWVKDLGWYMSFGDGFYSCFGWQVVLYEICIFFELFFKVFGIKLVCELDIFWYQEVVGYELWNVVVICDKKD